jgi:hypothetical protein
VDHSEQGGSSSEQERSDGAIIAITSSCLKGCGLTAVGLVLSHHAVHARRYRSDVLPAAVEQHHNADHAASKAQKVDH